MDGVFNAGMKNIQDSLQDLEENFGYSI